MNDWHIAYILGALNPVFLIVNILITCLEICSASVVAAGTQVFCVNLLEFLSVTARSSPAVSSTTTTPLPSSTGTMAPCNIVHSMLDLDTNSTVVYTIDMCTTTTTPFTTTTMVAQAAQRFNLLLPFFPFYRWALDSRFAISFLSLPIPLFQKKTFRDKLLILRARCLPLILS